MISDIYGYEGSKELRAFAKKLRLDRDALRSEGHPTDEHYIVPASKHPGMESRGAQVLGIAEWAARRAAKRPAQSLPSPIPDPEPYIPTDWSSPEAARRVRHRGTGKRGQGRPREAA